MAFRLLIYVGGGFMKNPIQKLGLFIAFFFVMVPGTLLSLQMDKLGEVPPSLNIAVIATMLFFSFGIIETLRRISTNEQIDFNQQKIDIIHSSFVLMDGNATYAPSGNEEEILPEVTITSDQKPTLVDNHLSN